MAIRGLINNFSTTLDGAITNVATVFNVIDATGISAELAVSNFVPLTIDDSTNREIVHVTSVTANAVTVLRGQEGTAGTAFASGTQIQMRVTRDAMLDRGEWRAVETRILGSNTANVDFIVSDYPGFDHKITFSGVTISVDSADVQFQQGIGATPTYQTVTYYASGNWRTYLSATNNITANNASLMTLLSVASNNVLNTIEGFFQMANPSNAAIRHLCKWELGQQTKDQQGTGIRDVTEAVTAFRFKLSTGSFVAGSKFIRSIRTQ